MAVTAVVPAKAGTQRDSAVAIALRADKTVRRSIRFSACDGRKVTWRKVFWIPACAGMTRVGQLNSTLYEV